MERYKYFNSSLFKLGDCLVNCSFFDQFYPGCFISFIVRKKSEVEKSLNMYTFPLIFFWRHNFWVSWWNIKYLGSLKSDSNLQKNICFICFNESPLEMVKNAFYFILKALFVLKVFKFLSWLFGQVEKTAWLEI